MSASPPLGPLPQPDRDVDRAFAAPTRPVEFEIPRPSAGGALVREADALRFAFEAERMGAWEYDLVAQVLSWSAGLSDLFGFAAAPGVGAPEPFLARLHPDDCALLHARARAGLEAGLALELELRIVLPDGSCRWILVRGRPRKDETGRVARIAGAVVDITDRRRHEDELRAKEERLVRANALLDAVNHAQASLLEQDFEHASAALLDDLLRLTDSECVWIGRVLGGSAFAAATSELVWHERRRERSASAASTSTALDRAFARVITYRLPLYSSERGVGCAAPGLLGLPLLSGGVLVGVAGFAGRPGGYGPEFATWLEPMTSACARWLEGRAIEERRRAAEEGLRLSEERLRTVLRATNDVVWDWDLARGELVWSARYAELFGYPASDLCMTVDECDRRVHPEDRPLLDASLAAALDGDGGLWTHEYRYRHADGSWRHVQDRGFVIRDARGRAKRMLGALQDVTQRRRSERELRDAEHLYRGLVHTVKAVLWRADPRTLDFDFVSQEAASLGYPLSDWLEPGFWAAHLHPDDRAEAIRVCTAATRELRDHEFEYRFLAADGRVVWLRDVATVRVMDGRVTGLVGVLFDITEVKQAQELVQQSEERFRALYEQARVAMARTGLDGRILDANPAFCAMLGYEREQLRSMTAADVSHPDDWPKNQMLRDDVIEGRSASFQMEKRYRRKDGSYLWCRATVTLVRDSRGMPECFLGILEDATERKQAERALREMNQELERRVQERTIELQSTLRELESFSYSVSHDLRAPLRGMDGFSQVLLEEYGPRLDEEARGYLRRIRANCASMSQLIDALLALARLSRDELVLGVVDLAPIAREIVDTLRAAEPAREVEFIVSGDLRANADPRLVRTLLENLLGNAWKFTSSKPRARIELSVEPGPTGERTYSVRDDGVGFDAALSSRLFQPFERLHSQAEFPGSGIGLATVQRIVRRHGGDVRIQGELGRGARVSFTLAPR